MQHLKKIIFVGFLGLAMNAAPTAGATIPWPAWDAFAGRFIQADGRVIDITFDRKSTSEGQSYGLFFALVANQRPQFDRILKWTSDNLAGGQLGDKLPAWLWGQQPDGSWKIKDNNAAADADLWLAYSLLEAGRLWKAPEYTHIGHKLLEQITQREVTSAGQAGILLLPGPIGFKLDKDRYRINPSYLPEFMFHYLAIVDPKGPWNEIWNSYERMLPEVLKAGMVPDEFVVDAQGRVMPDTEAKPSGSYDAIRVYLWAGMTVPPNKEMLKRLMPYSRLIESLGEPPEKVDPVTGKAVKSNYSPIGFSGAVLPFLHAIDEKTLLERQRARVRAAAARGGKTNYFDQVLILFGSGWLDGQYRFDAQGRLRPKWAH